jgi:acyl carrier protein
MGPTAAIHRALESDRDGGSAILGEDAMAHVHHAREARDRVIRLLASLVPPEIEVSRTTRTEDLELDSLDLMSAIGSIESELGVTLPLGDLVGTETVGDVLDLVDRQLGLAGDKRVAPPLADSLADSPELRALIEAGAVRWIGTKPVLPKTVDLEGRGKTAAAYVIEQRR